MHVADLSDKFREECGVMGVWGHKDAARLTYLGLFALQHRGQESAGIVTHNGNELLSYKGLGEVNEVFNEDILAKELPGSTAIGHVRYSTTGSSTLKNAQPLMVESWRGMVALGHNGNLVNTAELRDRLSREGSIFQSSSDTEVILHLLLKSRKADFLEAFVDALSQVKGAYSMVMLAGNQLIAVRDPNGVRPLCLGEFEGATVVASETCAFDLIGAKYIRDVQPGEILIVDRSGQRSLFPFKPVTHRPCVFEYVYFARPDSLVFGQSVQEMRKAYGRQLARETSVEADVVVPVPDSGVFAALGFSQESGIPYDMGIIRNHYIGRTFIDPGDGQRQFKVKVKLNPVSRIIAGKRIVIIDDSIVRGTTSKALVAILRQAGAREVHMRVSSPPVKWSCFYGIDTYERSKLIAAQKSVDEIRQYLDVDSLGYLSLEGMLREARAVGGNTFCTACWDGNYAVEFPAVQDVQLRLPLSEPHGTPVLDKEQPV